MILWLPVMPEQAGFALALGNGLMGVFWLMTELRAIAFGGRDVSPRIFQTGKRCTKAAPTGERVND